MRAGRVKQKTTGGAGGVSSLTAAERISYTAPVRALRPEAGRSIVRMSNHTDKPTIFAEPPHMNIVLIGFASCGKSAAGQELARRLALRFIDIDFEIEALYANRRGRRVTYRRIIQTEGMQFFFDLEHEALSGLADVCGCVIAPGGGAAMHERNRSLLRRLGTIVYLRTEPAVLFERMRDKGLPLFLRDDPSPGHLERLWRERHAVYAPLADHTVDNTHLDIAATVDRIMAALAESGFPAAVRT